MEVLNKSEHFCTRCKACEYHCQCEDDYIGKMPDNHECAICKDLEAAFKSLDLN